MRQVAKQVAGGRASRGGVGNESLGLLDEREWRLLGPSALAARHPLVPVCSRFLRGLVATEWDAVRISRLGEHGGPPLQITFVQRWPSKPS